MKHFVSIDIFILNLSMLEKLYNDLNVRGENAVYAHSSKPKAMGSMYSKLQVQQAARPLAGTDREM